MSVVIAQVIMFLNDVLCYLNTCADDADSLMMMVTTGARGKVISSWAMVMGEEEAIVADNRKRRRTDMASSTTASTSATTTDSIHQSSLLEGKESNINLCRQSLPIGFLIPLVSSCYNGNIGSSRCGGLGIDSW